MYSNSQSEARRPKLSAAADIAGPPLPPRPRGAAPTLPPRLPPRPSHNQSVGKLTSSVEDITLGLHNLDTNRGHLQSVNSHTHSVYQQSSPHLTTNQPPSQVTQLPHAQHEPYPLPTQTLPLKQSIQGEAHIHHNERNTPPFVAPSPSHATKVHSFPGIQSTIPTPENTKANNASSSDHYVAPSAKVSRDIIRDCPYPNGIKFSIRWYYLRSAPKYQVCSYCFSNEIQKTDFAVNFDSEFSLPGEARYCRFQIPRIQQLWNTSKRLKDFGPLLSLMKHRAGIQSCYGEVGATSVAGVKWFSPISGDIPGFVVCNACYEDYILASCFGNLFQVHKDKQVGDAVWACDLSLKPIIRALKQCSDVNDWRKFRTFVSMRLKLPKCSPYQWLSTKSVKWYQPKSLDFILCETCYVDSTAFSPFEKHFEIRPDKLLKERETWLCLQGWITMKIAWEEGFDKRGYNHWLEQARIMTTNPMCTANPVKREKWFVLANGFENFHVCPSCFGVLILSYGYAPHFREQTYPGGAEMVCSLFPTARHAGRFLEKLLEVIHVDEFSLLQNEIMKWASILPCPRSEGVKGRKFYGSDDFLVCPECYEDVVKGTVLESHFIYHNKIFSKANNCDLYSPRMRSLWAEACTKNDYNGFILICRQRREIYWQTIPVVKNILAQQHIRLSQQKMLNASSNFYNRLNSTTAPSSQINYTGYSQPRYTYGAADVGFGFETQYGVEGARLQQQASSLAFQGGGDIARARFLEETWKAVE